MSDLNTARASNPAQLPFSFRQYLRCYSFLLVLPVLMLIGGIVLALTRDFSIWIGAGLGIIFGISGMQTLATSAKRRWQEGNLCAALVVSNAPYTIAVLADLCNNGSSPQLAIKIRTVPLQSMAGGPPKKGDKLAAISLYKGTLGTGAWEDFTTMIANCGCTDLKQIKRATDSIDIRDWQILSQAMTSLKPTDLGLHHLQV